MIHSMPDKCVRVTSRFPDGHDIVYFDLDDGTGLTLERNRYGAEISVLRMLHGYKQFAARYGDPAEAAADFADLTTLLADRHGPPSPALPSSLPAQSAHLPLLPPPSTFSGAAKRKGWGCKAAVAGLAIGAMGAHFAPSWHTADTSTVHAAAVRDALLRPSSRLDNDIIPPSASLAPQQPAPPPIPPTSARQPPPSRPPAPAPSFGLQQ